MKLRRSEFVHLIVLNETIVLVVHAVTQQRVTVTPGVARLIGHFETAWEVEEALPPLRAAFGHDTSVLRACIAMLQDRGVLVSQSQDEELEEIRQRLAPLHGRDPAALLDRFRRSCLEGSHEYWAVQTPRSMGAGGSRHRVDVLMFGDCDVQMEADFLRREAAGRGIELRVAATFPSDPGLAGERKHDAIILGALQARHAIVLGEARHHGGDPSRVYIEAARTLLTCLREMTSAPILIDGLPEPTVQPLGLADRGLHSHRNRFRRTNLELEILAGDFKDVFVVDVASTLGGAGAAGLLDDGLVSFTHFGSPGWMLQRPESERMAVHNQFPETEVLAGLVGGDPYRREAVMARTHMDALAVVLGFERKKCVIVDLDGVLWPGVLAETESPFAWSQEISSANSYIGLYFGIHEALLALKRRGVLLACVSKNDETTVRRLWQYEQHYPQHRLLAPDHFVTWRINWEDKAANIQSIMEELGFAPEAFLFIDDNPRERARVQESLPEIAVLGEDLFSLRRILLTDPRLQTPHISAESPLRTELVRAQLVRTRLRSEIPDEAEFLASLQVVCNVEQAAPECRDFAVLRRVSELFARTTQFNATGRKFSVAELEELMRSGGQLFVLRMRDRLADHGLVGAAVVQGDEILNLVMSCRVIGLGGERALLARIVEEQGERAVRAGIVETDRNLPVRNLYRDNGFVERADGVWDMRSFPLSRLGENTARLCVS